MTGALDSVIGFSNASVTHGESRRSSRSGDGAARLDCAIVTSTDGKAVCIERMEERLE
jgi:hypothetical protein